MTRLRVVGIFLLALAAWTALHKLADKVLPTESPMYSFEATACVQVRGTAISEMVRARSTASALETHVAGAAFMDVTPEATLAVLETRVAEYGCMWADVIDVLLKAFPDATPCALTPTAVTPEPSMTPTPRPTPTWEFLPTATPTSTPVPLCHACDVSSSPRYNCPSGYWCKLCAGGRWTCVRNESPSADCLKCLVPNIGTFPDVPSNGTSMPVAAPEWSMTGLAVWNEDTSMTASGEPFDAMAMAGAVDASLFMQFRDRILHICAIPGLGGNEARCVDVRVNDSGYLFREGTFVYESRPRGKWDVQRWWEGDGDGALSIIVDLTKSAMYALTDGSLETCAVTMEVLE